MAPNTRLNSEATKVIIGAVYPAMLSEPTLVRARAQTAYTVASAIATALIAAGILTGIGDAAWYVQSFGFAAVGAWMLTAALYIGISRRVFKVPRAQPNQPLTMDEFVSRALNHATDEADALEQRLENAAKSTYTALGLTGAAILAALLFPKADAPAPVSVLTLSTAGASAISEQCPSLERTIEGRLTTDSLDEDYAVLVVEDDCGAGKVTVRIPPRYILMVGSASDD